MFNFFKAKTLTDEFDKTVSVKLRGIRFKLKKIDPLSYVNGSNTMLAKYELYKTGKQSPLNESDLKQMKKHYVDCFMASVVEPKLCRTKEDEEEGNGFFVEKFFTDWTFATALYQEIMKVTYGKKKFKQIERLERDLSKST